MEPFETMQKTQTIILYKIEEKLRYLEDSSSINDLRTESVEEEADNETWDQCKEKVSSILKSKLKITM